MLTKGNNMDKAKYIANLYRSIALQTELKAQAAKRGDLKAAEWHQEMVDELNKKITEVN